MWKGALGVEGLRAEARGRMGRMARVVEEGWKVERSARAVWRCN